MNKISEKLFPLVLRNRRHRAVEAALKWPNLKNFAKQSQKKPIVKNRAKKSDFPKNKSKTLKDEIGQKYDLVNPFHSEGLPC